MAADTLLEPSWHRPTPSSNRFKAGSVLESSGDMEIAMTVVKAAGVQLSPVLYSREGTVDKVVRKIRELGQEGVQFATFPETVVPCADAGTGFT